MVFSGRPRRWPARPQALVAIGVVLGITPLGCGGEDRRPEPRQANRTASAEGTRPPARRAGGTPTDLVFLHAPRGSKNAHLYVAGTDGSRLRRVDRSDEEKQDPEASPDGTRIAYRSLAAGDYTDTPLFVLQVETGRTRSLTEGSGIRGFGPTWSPDGRMLAIAGKRRSGHSESVWLMRPDGSAARPVPLPGFEAQYPAWSPDGASIALAAVQDGGFAIYTVSPDGSNLKRLTDLGGSANTPSWSPDGRRIAYGDGDAGIFVMQRDGTRKRLVTRDGGAPLSWAPGPLILYGCTGERRRFAVCGVDPDRGSPRELLGGLEAGFAAWLPRGHP